MSVTTITMDRWGRDHWSTYAYLASIILNHEGVPSRARMRCDADIHPGLDDPLRAVTFGSNRKKYPTRLRDGEQEGHDDWSCVEDMVTTGLVEWNGTGAHPRFAFTDSGWAVWHQFNRHIAEHPHAWSNTFAPDPGLVPA